MYAICVERCASLQVGVTGSLISEKGCVCVRTHARVGACMHKGDSPCAVCLWAKCDRMTLEEEMHTCPL